MQQVSPREALESSKNTFNKWKDLWFANTKENLKYYQKNPSIVNIGSGKKLIIFAFGPSFQRNVEEVKKNKLHYQYDIMCVDKAFGVCLKNGLIPKYIFTADARVTVEECLPDNFNKAFCKKIILLAPCTSNPSWGKLWSEQGGKVYYFVNKDSIRSHTEFKKYFNWDKKDGEVKACMIPAATNVANSAYVVASLVLNYQEILLAAFDYCFGLLDKYYGAETFKAIDRDYKTPKKVINNHATLIDITGKIVQASHNMLFSSRWLIGFIDVMTRVQRRNTTINITGAGILSIPFQGKLT